MTANSTTDTSDGQPSRLTGRLRRRQQEISDRVHAAGDANAIANGWTVTATTGRLGMGARTYRDPRFGTRQGGLS